MRIQVKRAYEEPGNQDGTRILVDRLWPRGIRKADLPLDAWLKDLAPSAVLRKWFQHDPAKWDQFRRRYFAELDTHTEAVARLLELARKGTVTLIYGAHDAEHNNAVALKEFLEARLGARARGGRP